MAARKQPVAMLYHDIRLAIIGGRFVMLSPLEWSVFAMLVAGADATLSRDSLSARVYSVPRGARTIEVIICRLRRKLAMVGLEHLILTVRSQGYVLRSAVVADLDPIAPCPEPLPEGIGLAA